MTNDAMAKLYFTLDEVDVLATLVEHEIDGVYSAESFDAGMLNSLRTALREAEYSVELFRGDGPSVASMTPAEMGKTLITFRVAAGLTQRQVAAHFDVDKSAVAAWEHGRSMPRANKLVALDEMYRADGKLLALFGFGPSDPT